MHGVGSACSPTPDRDAGAGALCAAGALCSNAETSQFATNPGFTCQAVCDSASAVDRCADGGVCILSPIAGTEDGQLLGFGGGEAEYGLCTPLGSNGCKEAVLDFETEWSACAGPADCACDQSCAADPATTVQLCALPCAATSDCTDPAATCQGGLCWPNLCDAGGALDPACTVVQAGDGVCLSGSTLSESLNPAAFVGATESSCVQVGSAAAGSACDPNYPSRASAAGPLCQAGRVCVGVPDGGGSCRQLCTLRASGTQAECAAGEECELAYYDRGLVDVPFALGACYTAGANGCAQDWTTPGPQGACTTTPDCPCPARWTAGTCR